MQVKVLKNLLHKGVTHVVGAVIELEDYLVPHLEKNKIVTPNVSQNPAELHDKVETPVQPEQPTEPTNPIPPTDPEKEAQAEATKVQDEEIDIKPGEKVPEIEKEENELE